MTKFHLMGWRAGGALLMLICRCVHHVALRLFAMEHRHRLMCASLICSQSCLLIKLYTSYVNLYSLASASYPDTFWHDRVTKSRTSVRHVSNISLSNDFVIVTACGRDISASLPLFQKNLYSIVLLFKDYRILLGESDSADDTLEKFRLWKEQDSRVFVRTYGNLAATYSTNRAHRIAYCRNDLLRIVRAKKWITTAKFLLVIDIDMNANTILTVENFLTNFEYDLRDWAVMTASQTKLYYDIWAVRSRTLDYDCWKVVDPLQHQDIARKIYINVHMKPIPRYFGLVSVRSAFGGFGIYQTAYLNNCHYEAFDERSKQKCEHVSLHDCIIKNGGQLFINPQFQNSEGLQN